jgi:acid phosphatase
VDKILLIMEENRSVADVGAHLPYLTSQGHRYGSATAYDAITHPSLPNYLAMVSGSTGGVTSDCSPAQCPQRQRTLFQQVAAHGGSWRVLAESMPADCRRSDAGRYGHR